MTARTKTFDTLRAQQIWADYERNHDLSGVVGKIAGVERESGRIWIADSGVEISECMREDGIAAPVYLVRVGSDHFVRKGRR